MAQQASYANNIMLTIKRFSIQKDQQINLLQRQMPVLLTVFTELSTGLCRYVRFKITLSTLSALSNHKTDPLFGNKNGM